MAIRTASGQKDDDQTRAQAREELIRHEIVLQTARKSGAETPAVRAQAQYAAENVLVRAYLQQWLRQNPIGKEVIAKEYEAIKARSGTQEVLLRQILLATEDDAKKLLGQLAAGAKFEDLAQLASRDSSSKANGGLLPWMPVGVLPPVIGQEVGKLSKGQMTANAIPSPAGFHVIRLEDSRPFALPPLEQLQPQIVRNLETQALDAHLRQLRDQAQIK
jgi:peptidyl-prolyl cis-trans isomerase C